MKSGVLFAVLLLFSMSSHATSEIKAPVWETWVMPGDQGALSISDQPCTVPAAMQEWERIRANTMARFNVDIGEIRQSRLLWRGQVYAGCYAIGPDNGHVYNIDSLGERLQPTIPRDLFVPHEGALPTGGMRI